VLSWMFCLVRWFSPSVSLALSGNVPKSLSSLSSPKSRRIMAFCDSAPLGAARQEEPLQMTPSSSSTTTTTTTNATIPDTRRPTLRGVVFDMDGTLTVPNLDFADMYRRCGVDVRGDILAEVEIMPPEQKAKALQIIEDMEEEGRQTLQVMPGALELLSWLSAHNIPTALVTRNTQRTVQVLQEKIQQMQQQQQSHLHHRQELSFSHVIARDDVRKIPPKPDPMALHVIAKETWNIDLPSSEILMVGDSVANDVQFGRQAGVKTVLLRANNNKEHNDESAIDADICIERLVDLPRKIWNQFHVPGHLGTVNSNTPIHGLPAPEPSTELCRAVVDGDVALVHRLLEEYSLDDILRPDKEGGGNTALVWAAETGDLELTSLLLDAIETKIQNSGPVMNEDRQSMITTFTSFISHRGYLGATAINRTARRGHTLVLELLLKRLQSLNTGTENSWNGGYLLDIPNDKLQYPLHFAAFKQHPETLECLLRYGANPWVLDRKGRTPYQDTSCELCKDILKKAMEQCYSI